MYSRLYLVMCPPIASRGALLVLFSGFDFSQTLLGRIGFLHGYGAIYHDFHHTHNVGNFGGEGANHLLHQQHKSGFFDLHSFLSHTHTHTLSLSLCVSFSCLFLLSFFPSFVGFVVCCGCLDCACPGPGNAFWDHVCGTQDVFLKHMQKHNIPSYHTPFLF